MIHKQKTVWVLGLALALPLASTGAVSLKEQEKRTKIQSELDEELELDNEKCGTKITASINWDSFKGADTGQSVSGYCATALTAARQLCESGDAGKKAVQKGIKKYTCAYGGKGKRAVSLKAGTLSLKIDFEESNYEDFVKAYLENNLE